LYIWLNRIAMSKRVAVMDLGTNTFHLLIAEGSATKPAILYKNTIAVKLGEGGSNKGLIQPSAYQRGLDAMQQFSGQIKKIGVIEIHAIATSALRNAANGQEFMEQVKAETGVTIETINGDAEAEYIYEGIKASGCLSDKTSLIVDIGGGSVEFIICNRRELFWKQSFEVGAARLMDQFHRTDPIPSSAIADLNNYLEEKLTDLFSAASKYKVDNMIGSSGSFETFAAITEQQNNQLFDLDQTPAYHFKHDELLQTIDYIVKSNHQERAKNSVIIPVRVDMIVVAALCTKFVMDKLGLADVIMSTSSLKEGVLAKILT